jgi:hypothetical protein
MDENDLSEARWGDELNEYSQGTLLVQIARTPTAVRMLTKSHLSGCVAAAHVICSE